MGMVREVGVVVPAIVDIFIGYSATYGSPIYLTICFQLGGQEDLVLQVCNHMTPLEQLSGG